MLVDVPYANNIPSVQYNYSITLGSPITTLTTDTGNKGDFSFIQRTEYFRYATLPDTLLLQSPGSENQAGYLLNYVGVAYSFTKNLNLGMAVPWLNATNISSAGTTNTPPYQTITNLGSVEGISDTSIFGLWRFMDDDVKPNPLQLSSALTFGMTVPTGKTNLKTSTGDLFYVSDQPGTGAISAILGVVFSKAWGKLSVSNDYIYTYTTKGSQGTTLGSYFQYDIAAVYPLIETMTKTNLNVTISTILEMNGLYTAADTFQGDPIGDTGGNQIFISPGLRADVGSKISLYAGAALPMSQRYFGIQSNNQFTIYSGGSLIF